MSGEPWRVGDWGRVIVGFLPHGLRPIGHDFGLGTPVVVIEPEVESLTYGPYVRVVSSIGHKQYVSVHDLARRAAP